MGWSIKNHALKAAFSSQPPGNPSVYFAEDSLKKACEVVPFCTECCWCPCPNAFTLWCPHTHQTQPQLLWVLAENSSQLISSAEKEYIPTNADLTYCQGQRGSKGTQRPPLLGETNSMVKYACQTEASLQLWLHFCCFPPAQTCFAHLPPPPMNPWNKDTHVRFCLKVIWHNVAGTYRGSKKKTL